MHTPAGVFTLTCRPSSRTSRGTPSHPGPVFPSFLEGNSSSLTEVWTTDHLARAALHPRIVMMLLALSRQTPAGCAPRKRRQNQVQSSIAAQQTACDFPARGVIDSIGRVVQYLPVSLFHPAQ